MLYPKLLGQRSQAQQQTCNRMAKKKKSKGKNQGVATAQIPDLNLSEILSRETKGAVHKQLSAIFNELKHCCKEQRAQIPPQ